LALLKPCIFKKKAEYVDRRGFHPFPAPPPIGYSLAGLIGAFRKISEI
jgi:hypothetical protein